MSFGNSLSNRAGALKKSQNILFACDNKLDGKHVLIRLDLQL